MFILIRWILRLLAVTTDKWSWKHEIVDKSNELDLKSQGDSIIIITITLLYYYFIITLTLISKSPKVN